MGVAFKRKPEIRTSVALAYYELYSKLEYVSSTPTLFNAGTLHPQLSSCYLNQVSDTIAADEGDNRFASILEQLKKRRYFLSLRAVLVQTGRQYAVKMN